MFKIIVIVIFFIIGVNANAYTAALKTRPMHLFGTYYAARHGIMLPVSYISFDFGKNWQLDADFPIVTVQSQEIVGGNCNFDGEKCVVASFIFNNLGQQYDAISYYKMAGSPIWYHSNLFSNIPHHTFLTAVKCDQANHHCLALGFNNLNLDEPIIYLSDNGGANWFHGEKIAVENSTALTKLACDNQAQNCLAIAATPNKNNVAVIYQTSTGGKSWQQIPHPPLHTSNLDSLVDVTCDTRAQHCIAIGRAEKILATDVGIEPIYYLTDNTSQDWTTVLKMPVAANITRTIIKKITCDQAALHCLVVGEFSDPARGGYTSPLVYYSNDRGQHWQLAKKIDLPMTKKIKKSNIEMTSLTCDVNNQNCFMAGEVYIPSRLQRFPISYYSIDSGQSWHLSVTQPSINNSDYMKISAVA